MPPFEALRAVGVVGEEEVEHRVRLATPRPLAVWAGEAAHPRPVRRCASPPLRLRQHGRRHTRKPAGKGVVQPTLHAATVRGAARVSGSAATTRAALRHTSSMDKQHCATPAALRHTSSTAPHQQHCATPAALRHTSAQAGVRAPQRLCGRRKGALSRGTSGRHRPGGRGPLLDAEHQDPSGMDADDAGRRTRERALRQDVG